MTVLNLYTFRPNLVCDDSADDCQDFFIQGVMEALNDERKSKEACFLEIKREEALLLQKLARDLLDRTAGSFYRNHVLLDSLSLYRKYCEEFGDETAFGTECVRLSGEASVAVFELFSCATEVVVFVDSGADPRDPCSVLLAELESRGMVRLERVFRFR